MSRRDEWTFSFSNAELRQAAGKKKQHHTERLEFWQTAKAEIMAKIKEDGISVDESPGALSNLSNNTRSGYGPQIVIDATYQHRLNETTSKINEHRTKIAEYDGWFQVLGSGDGHQSLDANDYLYFFGI